MNKPLTHGTLTPPRRRALRPAATQPRARALCTAVAILAAAPFTNAQPAATSPAPATQPAASPPAGIDPALLEAVADRTLRELVNAYAMRVRLIRNGYLETQDGRQNGRLFRKGRRLLQRIRDPLAVPALAAVLAEGSPPTRRLLVELLARYPDARASLNLLVIAVLDPEPAVRDDAVIALAARNDPRIIDALEAALLVNEDPTVRSAASALGALRSTRSAGTLVEALVTGNPRERYTRAEWLAGLALRFPDAASDVPLPPAGADVLSPASLVGTGWDAHTPPPTVYRTEVHEALVQLTGRNFGFDLHAWRRWVRLQATRPTP